MTSTTAAALLSAPVGLRNSRPVHKILSLLTRREKVWLGLLLVAMLLMGVVDVLGVSSILPFMAAVAKPEVIQTTWILSAAYAWSGVASVQEFLFWLGLLALAVCIFSNAFAMFVQGAMLKFGYGVGHALSLRVIRAYLNQPYSFFLDRNSTTLMLNSSGEVEGAVNGVIIPTLQVIAKLLVTGCILLLVLVVNPLLAAVFLGTVGGAYVLIFFLVNGRIAEIGRKSQDANRSRYRYATEAFSSIKDLKLLGREHYYFDRFAYDSRRYASYQSRYGIVALFPRYSMEAVAFGAIIVLVLYFLATGRDLASAIPILVLYAFAGYRLMPAFQAIFYSLTMIRFNWSSIELLTAELKLVGRDAGREFQAQAESPIPFTRSIELDNVTFTYSVAVAPVLHGINLRIEKNTTIGLVGATGGGKTTIVDLLLGVLVPTSGRLLVDGTPINADNVRGWQANVGYVPQQIYLSDASVAKNIAFGIPDGEIDMVAVEVAARAAQLHDFIVGELPDGYATEVGERGVRLSGGQRQRIAIARALYRNPNVLVLDEATSALDGITEDAVADAVRKLSHEKTIITIAHRLTTVVDCDVIYMLENGRIIDYGSYQDLLARSETFRSMAKVSA